MLKRITALAIALATVFIITACSAPQSFSGLDQNAFGEEFREENSELFFNKDCKHRIKYAATLIPDPDIDINVYHYVSCISGNCNYDAHFEPHSIALYMSGVKVRTCETKENVSLYHRVTASCLDCRYEITQYILCRTQDSKCGNNSDPCMTAKEALEIISTLPYLTSIDKNPAEEELPVIDEHNSCKKVVILGKVFYVCTVCGYSVEG